MRILHSNMKLLDFVQGLRGQRVVVLTKQNYEISGTVANVDAYMNLYLREAEAVCEGRPPVRNEVIVVRGSTVRDIRLEDGLNVDLQLAKAVMRSKQRKETK